MKKMVYNFSEGDKSMVQTLGGKGAHLAEMTKIGIPVPPGFTITTEVCAEYYKLGKKISPELWDAILKNVTKVETAMKKSFGDKDNPLLFSVRSGAAVSMPGMMDSILNLGLNDEILQGLAKKNERFAYDSYRRLLQMFGDVVMKVDHDHFEHILDSRKKTRGIESDTELTADDLKYVVDEYKKVIKERSGKDFPQEPKEQLKLAIEAVFNSWNNDRAIAYRQLNHITGLIGTAVNVQTMVYGNSGEMSGTGVYFTRNPSTGENKLYGEYLMNAQGEDVVAGLRTPQHIETLKKIMPHCYDELVKIYKKVEKHYKDMQDMEFTIEDGKLWILQTRNGKRTAYAAIKIAVDMVKEKLITKKEALLKVDPKQIDQLLHKQLDPIARERAVALTKGLPASPGAAVGTIVFTAEDAEKAKEDGKKVVLVRTETSPEDIKGMAAAQGILTARGGMTSHAAVVARGMGKCCVSGCSELIIDLTTKTARVGNTLLKEGDYITLDGSTGTVIKGELPVVDPEMKGDFKTVMNWADETRKIGVRTNADTPHDATVAKNFGAEGIGLCRTEHMFFEGDRIKAVREMILSTTELGRRAALDKLLPMQRGDFEGIFKAMGTLPVTIRLLDPPLHEFLPTKEEEMQELAREMKVSIKVIKEVTESLHELNPMLGHRGCRLVITYPEMAEMQTRAIIEAACNVKKETGNDIVPEIMIPIVGHVNEFVMNKKIVDETAAKVMKEKGMALKYKVGTMIEIPRAALTADKIAEHAEFFSFGTNDLTQMTFGFSRDDIGKFLPDYLSKGVLEIDPFVSVDQEGVGQLMQLSVQNGRRTRKDLKVGICGEQGGEPKSVAFCHKIGLNYVSCSPYRVPIARLAAAHAAIKDENRRE
ncbi:pyruvate, phosphate dikinase [Candidatus Woesearchaeota archaeon]|nr:pyruvate, phosphate dikinase [Candidatus Woesearchaeota archaeon]